ncbi:MAG: hypothetical protein A3G05_02350 [Candidatus Zambryskibacteria bacterium RIFCSPLOWO2_12_FULL_45_14]|uniref:Uncharacterized protein n=1 Tax=Candidatus Zambryskibacteria bacterium RIFCSPLOWO2_12_FULL_45_14 TaxID=1802778 RepID=A0A1G2UW16_9BACT|nr:MAG: hypothetical protein A3G05_02350 [Candidatus Zambryskibacteria bacterium RIFCSPLOWO2_12_FULL_45_14]
MALFKAIFSARKKKMSKLLDKIRTWVYTIPRKLIKGFDIQITSASTWRTWIAQMNCERPLGGGGSDP